MSEDRLEDVDPSLYLDYNDDNTPLMRVRSTTIYGIMRAEKWCAVLACGHTTLPGRRPVIGQVLTCETCTMSLNIDPTKVKAREQDIYDLAKSHGRRT